MLQSDIMSGLRRRAFVGPGAEQRAHRAGMWVRAALFNDDGATRWCRENGLALRAQGENVNSAGGALVVEELEAAIISYRGTAGSIRQYADVRPMGSDTRNLPRRTSGLTATWTPQNAALTETSAAFDSVALVARKLTTLTKISRELFDDEATGIAEWLAQEIGYSFAVAEDDAAFVGTGTSAYAHITGFCTKLLQSNYAASVTTATGHSTLTAITSDDLAALATLLPEQFWGGARWFCSGVALGSVFLRLGAIYGGTVMGDDGPRPQFTFAGVPIVTNPRMPGAGTVTGKIVIAFGDLGRAATLGDRRGVRILVSPHRLMDQDQLLIVGTERVAINVHDLGSATSAGPLVGLVAG